MKRISFLITHYNRPDALKLCLESIVKIKDKDDEIVVSDDASSLDIIEEISTIPEVRLVKSSINEGLANNINKGIKACKGKYIIYCQEDFVLDLRLKNYLSRFTANLENDDIDLIRFSSYFKFNQTQYFDEQLNIIPRFHWANFFQNYYRYRDHPFMVEKGFYEKNGYYLENTSGRYGETEYGIRLSNSNVVIAITSTPMAFSIEGSQSTLSNEVASVNANIPVSKKLRKFMRALRLYIEWFLYQKRKRGLITYKNGRKVHT